MAFTSLPALVRPLKWLSTVQCAVCGAEYDQLHSFFSFLQFASKKADIRRVKPFSCNKYGVKASAPYGGHAMYISLPRCDYSILLPAYLVLLLDYNGLGSTNAHIALALAELFKGCQM